MVLGTIHCILLLRMTDRTALSQLHADVDIVQLTVNNKVQLVQKSHEFFVAVSKKSMQKYKILKRWKVV